MESTQTIETLLEFQYPPIYHRLAQDQMLDNGTYDAHWKTQVLSKLLEKPPLLSHTYGFELIPLSEVLATHRELYDPEGYASIHPDYQVIPFGYGGEDGGHYCFFMNEQTSDGEAPAVYLDHE
ncbi:hypothetical protein [Eisenibacter elegans]|uniref:hypothetical protein n=1 Tax=Eisenibacter elegans TaxID=997 RepID=UPI0004205958|nr:hypothetical protein [Eisenibacter elegans]